MKKREIIKLGIEDGDSIALVISLAKRSGEAGLTMDAFRSKLRELIIAPNTFVSDPLFGQLAEAQLVPPLKTKHPYQLQYLQFNSWGQNLDSAALQQMENACSLPVSAAGALMPDAHVGYGLPIGGVLATRESVIPYAVGVDIACRVKLSVFDFPVKRLKGEADKLKRILEENTRFGIGASWENRQSHDVMDQDWSASPVTAGLRDTAWRQLGTSGSGNHFVEFGEISFGNEFSGITPGTYLGLVSHSGSRGAGAKVASHYSSVARSLHPDLPKHLAHLAWLPMNGPGEEYWQAMELMGQYASANHEIIHRRLCKALGSAPLAQIENHHNFAWREFHNGEELIVHRKGATPAGRGVMGYIPGTMVDPGYLVMGLGNPNSLNSCSHGAGRVMSRTKARESITRHQLNRDLHQYGVELISAGVDEAPMAYKDIREVMRSQSDLVEIVAAFQPRIVIMAPEGERAED